MHKIAIIQFPGLNTEYETRREINKAGMRGDFFRWNEAPSKLKNYDGYVIGGGFSYEDRGRAGIIASLDPIMKTIKEEAEQGKPVLGICNGAQILVESGLIPGVDGNKLTMSLARNRRIREGKVLGTGYYNAWVNLKCSMSPQNCMFTWNLKPGEIIKAPIAHGEGRFTTDIPDLMPTLHSKNQLALRYCDKQGIIMDQFPVNPNGASFNTAAICNPAGNVMAMMPHLERDLVSSAKLFTSLRDALTARRAGGIKKRVHHIAAKPVSLWPLAAYVPAAKSIQMFISLIITDNEAETYELTLKNIGFPKIALSRQTHFELEYKSKTDFEKLCRKLIQSGVLLNTNKEIATVQLPKQLLRFDAKREKFTPAVREMHEGYVVYRLLVREKPDFAGMSKTATIQNRLKLNEILQIRTGTLWEIHIPTKSRNVAQEDLKKLINTHLFANPHRQEAVLIG